MPRIRNKRCSIAAVLGLLLLAQQGGAAETWHLPEWSCRAVVDITQPAPDAGVDTAAVRILCQGQANSEGSDYRVIDSAGKPVPFQITVHDAGRYSLLSF